MKLTVPIARSDIHVHLSQEHLEALFGRGYTLEVLRPLTQPGQFCAKEQVTVAGPAGSIDGVYVVGPVRPVTQVEISITNGITLGIQPPVRESGDLAGTPGCSIIGPAGRVDLPAGVIAARRHIHIHTSDALRYGIVDGQVVRVALGGERALVFENVLVRAGDSHALEMHVDFDEGHAADIEDFQEAEILP